MKFIKLFRHTDDMVKEVMKEHSDKCSVIRTGGKEHTIDCYCDEKKVYTKKSKKDILKEIDSDGNGHITRKEVMDWSNK